MTDEKMQESEETVVSGQDEILAEAEGGATDATPRKDKKAEKQLKDENKKLTAELEAAKSELEKTAAQLAELNDKYMRMAAEYENFRKRSQKEKLDTYADAYGDALAAALPILDNLERAAAYTDGAQLVDGIKLIFKSAKESFEKIGVIEYGAPGEDFDPNLHNAVQQVESEEYEEGKIVSVYQKGYKKGDRILREAIVTVAQ